MKKKSYQKTGQSMMEVVTVLVLVVTVMWIFQKYIAQGIYGRWKGVGDSWSHGRQYDKNDTTECVYNIWGQDRQVNDPPTPAFWYNAVCFDENCKSECLGFNSTPADCDACLEPACRANVSGVDVCN